MIIKNVKLAAEYQKDFDILFAGYFSSEKGNDDYGSGYSILYGYQPWETNHIVDNNLNISIYFTPYTAVFSDYKKSSPVEYRYYDYDKESDVSEKYANAMNVIFPLIEQANNSIYIYSYAFTDKALMSLLAKAYDRGVKIFLWLDYSQFNSNYAHSGQSIIALSKIIGNVRLCRKENGGLLHHKVMIIDRKTVLFGSLNFSSNAVTSNDENFLIIRDNTGIAEYFIQESNNINKYSNKLRIKETEDTTNAENIE